MTRHQKILNYLLNHIDKPTPTNQEMGKLFGMSEGSVDRSMSELKGSGAIIALGRGSSRYFYFRGCDGHTMPRMGQVQEHVPVVKYTSMDRPQACPRCQVRGCTRHSASHLVTSVPKMGWGATA